MNPLGCTERGLIKVEMDVTLTFINCDITAGAVQLFCGDGTFDVRLQSNRAQVFCGDNLKLLKNGTHVDLIHEFGEELPQEHMCGSRLWTLARRSTPSTKES